MPNGELWFQAGGGIVAASDEEYELQEVNNKLGALRRAITLAERGFVQKCQIEFYMEVKNEK